jgi:hypothetical protein
VEHDALLADEERKRLEAQIGEALEPGGEVGAERVLPRDATVVTPGQRPDERGRHLDVVGVVLEDRLEVVRVPGGVPPRGEVLGAVALERHPFLLSGRLRSTRAR